MCRRIGVGAAVRPVQSEPAGEDPIQLIAGEDSAADQVPGLAGHPVVIEPDGGQAVFDRPVAGHIHDR